MDTFDETTGEVRFQSSLRFHGDCGKLFEALAAAQAEFPDIPRSRTVTVRKDNKILYTYDYSPLDNTQRILRPILAMHGIAIMQPPCDAPNGRYRVVTVMAGHGGMVEADISCDKVEGIKDQAGVFTYLQRYGYEGIVGVKADTDDDGNRASGDAHEVADRKPASKVSPTPTPSPAPTPPPSPSPTPPPSPTPAHMTGAQYNRIGGLLKSILGADYSREDADELCQEYVGKSIPASNTDWTAEDAEKFIVALEGRKQAKKGAAK